MQALLTGGTGFIGEALTEALLARDWRLVILTRQKREDSPAVQYVNSLDEIDSATVFNAVINLAGASLAAQRWSEKYKREIVASRVDLTGDLLALFSRLHTTPEVLLSASAIGYYGHQGDQPLTELSAVVPGFSQQLCQQWEAVASQAQQFGTRVCLLRLGVVLDSDGGALREMRRSFKFGVASWMGSGAQWLSWVHRRDVVAAIQWLLEADALEGAFNLTAPQPVTGREFAAALKQHHKTLFSAGLPAPLMRLALGEMADELLLNGQRVLPHRLQASGYNFAYPDLQSALTAIYHPA